jgi:hypothetical protein
LSGEGSAYGKINRSKSGWEYMSALYRCAKFNQGSAFDTIGIKEHARRQPRHMACAYRAIARSTASTGFIPGTSRRVYAA